MEFSVVPISICIALFSSWAPIQAHEASAEKTHVTLLAKFKGKTGATPYAGLIRASDGNYYGTTSVGGKSGVGTVYRMTPAGKISVIHDFDCHQGCYSFGKVVQAADGNFYGGTTYGPRHGPGVIYQLKPNGDYKVLHQFDGTDGSYIESGLTQGSDGLLYGVSLDGGALNVGTAFRISTAGAFKLMAQMAETPAAGSPVGELLEGEGGAFYGTTGGSGSEGDLGTIFSMDANGNVTVLHTFESFADGSYPFGQLAFTADRSAIVGTTRYGGVDDNGTVFKYSAGVFTKLSDIGALGFLPSSLALGSDGATFYGFTLTSGRQIAGRLFSITADGPALSVVRIEGEPTDSAPVVTPDGGLIVAEVDQNPPHGKGAVIEITDYQQ